MGNALSVRQVNAAFQTHFTEPAFDLFRDLPALLSVLYSKLGRYGLRLADTRFEASGANLAETPHLRCDLFDFRTTLRIHLDRIELSSTLPAGLKIEHEAVTVDATDSVLQHMPGLTMRAYTATTGLHGVPQGISTGELLARAGQAQEPPPGRGPFLGMGSVFYYGAAEEQLASSLTVDLSRLVDTGVFIQVNTIYDAQKIALAEVARASTRRLYDALTHLELTLEG